MLKNNDIQNPTFKCAECRCSLNDNFSTDLEDSNPELKPRFWRCTMCLDASLYCHGCAQDASPPMKGVFRTHHGHLLSGELLPQHLAKSLMESQKSVRQLFRTAFTLWTHRPALGYLSSTGRYYFCTYRALWGLLQKTCHLLTTRYGVLPGHTIGIKSNNRIEWILCDLAALMLRAVVVPLDPHIGASTLASILSTRPFHLLFLEHCDSALFSNPLLAQIETRPLLSIFPEDLSTFLSQLDFYPLVDDYSKFEPVFSAFSSLHDLPSSPSNPSPSSSSSSTHPTSFFINELLGITSDCILDSVDFDSPESIASISCILYTSGSTGTPKGAIFTESNWCKLISDIVVVSLQLFVAYGHSSYSHMTPREEYHQALLSGAQYGFATDYPRSLFPDMQSLQPTRFAGCPRIWNIVFSEFQRLLMIQEANYLAELLPDGATAAQLANTPIDPLARTKLRDSAIEQVRSMLGDRMVSFSSGGALLSSRVRSFLIEAWGSAFHEGYGCTECGQIANHHMQIYPDVRFKLRDVPELSYFSSDRPHPRGELLVQTPSMFSGYSNGPPRESDAEAWFATGDIVEIRYPRTLRILDRCANIFKLSQSKFVAPEKLEAIFSQSSLISQICICRPPAAHLSFLTNPVAVIFPASPSSPQLTVQIRDSFAVLAQANELHAYEIPHFLLLIDQPFSQANGFLTKSDKLARLTIQKHFEPAMTSLIDAQIPPSGILPTDDQQPSQDLLAQLRHHLTRALPQDFLSRLDQASYRSLGGDSLGAFQLVQSLPPDLRHLLSPADLLQEKPLASVLSDQSNHASLRPPPLPELVSPDYPSSIHFDKLSFGFKILCSRKDSSVPVFQRHLLTGCSGFLGAHFLARLLQPADRPDVIYGLVRAAHPNEALQKMRQIFCTHQLDPELLQSSRFRLLVGDLEAPHFGWAPETWTKLASKIHTVYHLGAYVNHMLPYDVLAPANVEGTRTILQFCADSFVKPLLYVSTLSVLPSYFLPTEQFSTLDQHIRESWEVGSAYPSGYAQSKFIAEHLCHLARKAGLPVFIVRPGLVSWHTRSGIGNHNDWLHRAFQGYYHINYAPRLDAVLDLTPVDFAAEFLHRLASLMINMQPQSYNMYGIHRIPWSQLCLPKFPKQVHLEYFKNHLQQLSAKSSPPSKELIFLSYHDWESIDDSRRPIVQNSFSSMIIDGAGIREKLAIPPLGQHQIQLWHSHFSSSTTSSSTSTTS